MRVLSMRDLIYVFVVRRNGIIPARVPGMTTTEAPEREPAATRGAVCGDGFGGVFRTARMKTAMVAEQRTDQITVTANQQYQERAHCFTTRNQCWASEV